MAITSSISPFYAARMLFFGVLCAVVGVWGVYDYVWKIPSRMERFAKFEQLKSTFDDLELRRNQPGGLTQAQIEQYDQVTADLNEMMPNGEKPAQPSKFDHVSQWAYIACIPFAPYLVWLFVKARRQVYRLDDDGTLHFQGDPQLTTGAWTKSDIADIDMSRWMAKSIAQVVHQDGRRLKLDAYVHKRLELIIGSIASRLHPQDWDADAKPIKGSSQTAPTGTNGDE
jgi:hypothetical protein